MPPLGGAAVVLITAFAVTMEALGIDVLPDDAGLEQALKKAKKAHDAYQAAVAAPPPLKDPTATGFNPDLRASMMREQLQTQRIEAEIELERLSSHVRDEIYKYHHAIWAQWSASRIARAMHDAGIDPNLVEHRFSGFDLDRAILRVVDLERLEREKLKWQDFASRALQGVTTTTRTLKLPAPGAWAEARRGNCDALDTFVSRHREVDLALREALLANQQAVAAQQAVETDRLKARVAAGMLDDPTPYRRTDHLEVDVSEPGDAAPAPGATPSPPAPSGPVP